MHRLAFTFVLVVVVGSLGTACSGETAKEATSAVVGKAIEVGKGTATGIAAGVEEGRKNAESADGAKLVSKLDELKAVGGVTRGETTDAGDHADVVLLFENTTEQPARLTGIETLALDKDGVTLEKSGVPPGELTVPAKAKSKYTFSVKAKAADVKTVRVWGEDVK